MKPKIHPKYYDNATVTCGCGNTFTVGSTKPTLHVDICSKCHPFYTGQQRIVDTAGQVDRFMKRLERTAETSEQVRLLQETQRRTAQEARLAKRRGDA